MRSLTLLCLLFLIVMFLNVLIFLILLLYQVVTGCLIVGAPVVELYASLKQPVFRIPYMMWIVPISN